MPVLTGIRSNLPFASPFFVRRAVAQLPYCRIWSKTGVLLLQNSNREGTSPTDSLECGNRQEKYVIFLHGYYRADYEHSKRP